VEESVRDITLTADISFLGKGANEHPKSGAHDPPKPGCRFALRGRGAAWQRFDFAAYREEKGTVTHEIQANISAPARLRIEKRGAYFSLWLAEENGEFHLAGGSMRIALKEPFYVGIGVCSHDKNVVEKAVFSNVDLKAAEPAPVAASAYTLYSTLEIITVASTERRAIYVAPGGSRRPTGGPMARRCCSTETGGSRGFR